MSIIFSLTDEDVERLNTQTALLIDDIGMQATEFLEFRESDYLDNANLLLVGGDGREILTVVNTNAAELSLEAGGQHE